MLGLDDTRPLEIGERRGFRAIGDTIKLSWDERRGGPVLEIETLGRDGHRAANAELEAWVERFSGAGMKAIWCGLWAFANDDALVQTLSSMTEDGASCWRSTWSDPPLPLVESMWERFVREPGGTSFELAHWNAWYFSTRRDHQGMATHMTANPTAGPIAGWETFVASLPAELPRRVYGPNRETYVWFATDHPDYPGCVPAVLAATNEPPNNLQVDAS